MGRDRVQDMIRLNILALTDLTHGLLPLIKKAPSGQGRIVLISSVASYQPIPYFAVYAATKAFVTHLGEALYEELHKEGIQVTTICPGVTKTEFGRNGQGLAQHFFDRGDTAASVVQKSIRGIERGAVVVNTADQIRIVLSRLVPRFLVRKIAALIARRLLAQR
jgi:short-subunit dehydrogenase